MNLQVILCLMIPSYLQSEFVTFNRRSSHGNKTKQNVANEAQKMDVSWMLYKCTDFQNFTKALR